MAEDGGHIEWESVAVDGWLEININFWQSGQQSG